MKVSCRTKVTDHELETVDIPQAPRWLGQRASSAEPTPSAAEMESWIELGSYSLDMTEHTHFVPLQIITELTDAKTLLDDVDHKTFIQARDGANPFEFIKKEFFGTSRATLKMANINAACGFMFTSAAEQEQEADRTEGNGDRNHTTPAEDRLLYFSDVCSGPGGFSEYVLWKKKWRAKGYGYTLAGKLDFKLNTFHVRRRWCNGSGCMGVGTGPGHSKLPATGSGSPRP